MPAGAVPRETDMKVSSSGLQKNLAGSEVSVQSDLSSLSLPGNQELSPEEAGLLANDFCRCLSALKPLAGRTVEAQSGCVSLVCESTQSVAGSFSLRLSFNYLNQNGIRPPWGEFEVCWQASGAGGDSGGRTTPVRRVPLDNSGCAELAGLPSEGELSVWGARPLSSVELTLIRAAAVNSFAERPIKIEHAGLGLHKFAVNDAEPQLKRWLVDLKVVSAADTWEVEVFLSRAAFADPAGGGIVTCRFPPQGAGLMVVVGRASTGEREIIAPMLTPDDSPGIQTARFRLPCEAGGDNGRELRFERIDS